MSICVTSNSSDDDDDEDEEEKEEEIIVWRDCKDYAFLPVLELLL